MLSRINSAAPRLIHNCLNYSRFTSSARRRHHHNLQTTITTSSAGRTMSSSSHPGDQATASAAATQDGTAKSTTATATADTTTTKPIGALPAPGEGSTSDHPVLDVSSGGGSISLDAMGPIVVNTDGTISRVQNWSKMTQIEKDNTLRVLGKRNQQRLATLRAAENAPRQESEEKHD